MVHSDPLKKKKLSGARKVFLCFFIVISVSAQWWHAAAEQALRGPEGTQAAGTQGTQDTRPRRAPKQPAPQGTQAAGPAPQGTKKQAALEGAQAASPAGHPGGWPRRAPKKQAVPEGTQGAKRHSGRRYLKTAALGGTQGTNGRGSKQPAAPESCQD